LLLHPFSDPERHCNWAKLNHSFPLPHWHALSLHGCHQGQKKKGRLSSKVGRPLERSWTRQKLLNKFSSHPLSLSFHLYFAFFKDAHRVKGWRKFSHRWILFLYPPSILYLLLFFIFCIKFSLIAHFIDSYVT